MRVWVEGIYKEGFQGILVLQQGRRSGKGKGSNGVRQSRDV